MRLARVTLACRLLALSVIASPFAVSAGQISESIPVAFDVASIKPSTRSGGGPSLTAASVSGYAATNMTLRSVIADAFLVKSFQVIGGPDWLDSARFDIDARAPLGADDSLGLPMLKTLLADRFKLVMHAEQREETIPALVLARPDGEFGPYLQESSSDCYRAVARQSQGRGNGECGLAAATIGRTVTVKGRGTTTVELAAVLAGLGNRPVIDRTGLRGAVDLEFSFTKETLATALQEQLGLALAPIRYPVEFLVIDSVQPPTLD
jgi:uncharacterized protein (TIGR03435 family)